MLAQHLQLYFFDSGIPIHKVNLGLGTLLQRVGLSIGHYSDLLSIVPRVHKQELEEIKKELEGQSFSMIFDGTTRVGEVLAVVVRFCAVDFSLHTRLVALTTAAKHMTGNELSAQIIRVLIQRVGAESLDNVLATSRDSCATNGAAPCAH